METNVKQSPFLKLLEPENLSKINIEAELIPIFKKVIIKINDYFIENDLMDAKDWDSFFEKYLLTPNDSQHSIKKDPQCRTKCACGEYYRDSKEIIVTSVDSKILCHEFIHFLVMADRTKYKLKVEDYTAFNEGMTERLAILVMGGVQNSLIGAYQDEVELAGFYCSLSGKRSPFKYFLNNEFYFDYDKQKWQQAWRWAAKFFRFHDDYSRNSLQRFITDNALKDYVITSFDEYLDFVYKFNNHSYYFNKNEYQIVINKIIERYITNLNFSEENKQLLRQKMMSLAFLSKRVQKYGSIDAFECDIDGQLLTFSRDGKHLRDLFRTQTHKPVQIQIDQHNNVAIVTYDGKTYEMNFECKNYQREYERCLIEIQSFIKSLTMSNGLEELNTEYEKEKQRMLQELEEEYMRNSFENSNVRKSKK